ncbi:homocysteine S-methyltransferase family protein [Ignavibacterium sp.]|uniref:homocysteine S-methyltransferase family protein n=1 Tax=Ignavibacterium sp. TaxID=2651167 RepID=UPI00307D3F67
MIKDIHQYHFSFDELNFNEEKLIQLFSDFSSANNSLLIDSLQNFLPFIKANCNPVAGFRFFDEKSISFQKNILLIENLHFELGTIIYRNLKEVSELFVFVCTIGKIVEDNIHKLFSDCDSLNAFILDRIASELVECTADLLEKKIQSDFLKSGYNLTNRYSPGYCGWSVSEQQKLFSLLPDKFCGVQLTESSLMIPLKSISGFYGAGYNLVRKNYSCEICDDEFCYKRKLREDRTMKKFFRELNDKKILVSDGAWGTELFKSGLRAGECPELWNETRPDEVFSIAKNYIKSGSDILSTNSFGGSLIKLSHYNLENKTYSLNKTAAEISRKAAGNKLVMGSVGPTGKFLISGDVSADEMIDSFTEQLKGLIDGGVDAILLETFYDIDEAECAVKAVRNFDDIPLICSFTYDRNSSGEYRTMMGATPKEVLQAMITLGVDVIGVNCGGGYNNTLDLVKELREFSHNIPILIQPNAGLPETIQGEIKYSETPDVISNFVKSYLNIGINIIGGCCGTTPEHIKVIRKAVDEFLSAQ